MNPPKPRCDLCLGIELAAAFAISAGMPENRVEKGDAVDCGRKLRSNSPTLAIFLWIPASRKGGNNARNPVRVSSAPSLDLLESGGRLAAHTQLLPRTDIGVFGSHPV